MRVVGLSLVLLATPVLAAPPVNDNWTGRITIPPASLSAPGGFTDTQGTIGEATTEASAPILVCKNVDPAQRGNTVWYIA